MFAAAAGPAGKFRSFLLTKGTLFKLSFLLICLRRSHLSSVTNILPRSVCFLMPFNGLSFVHIKLDVALITPAMSLALVPMFFIFLLSCMVLTDFILLYIALRSVGSSLVPY